LIKANKKLKMEQKIKTQALLCKIKSWVTIKLIKVS
jgi:hypothetical protein